MRKLMRCTAGALAVIAAVAAGAPLVGSAWFLTRGPAFFLGLLMWLAVVTWVLQLNGSLSVRTLLEHASAIARRRDRQLERRERRMRRRRDRRMR